MYVHNCSTGTACICFSTNIPAFATVLLGQTHHISLTLPLAASILKPLFSFLVSQFSMAKHKVFGSCIYTEHILFYKQTKYLFLIHSSEQKQMQPHCHLGPAALTHGTCKKGGSSCHVPHLGQLFPHPRTQHLASKRSMASQFHCNQSFPSGNQKHG